MRAEECAERDDSEWRGRPQREKRPRPQVTIAQTAETSEDVISQLLYFRSFSFLTSIKGEKAPDLLSRPRGITLCSRVTCRVEFLELSRDNTFKRQPLLYQFFKI